MTTARMRADGYIAAACTSNVNRDHKYAVIPSVDPDSKDTSFRAKYDKETFSILDQTLRLLGRNSYKRVFMTAMGALGVFIFFSLSIL
jgi:hypothetical protein